MKKKKNVVIKIFILGIVLLMLGAAIAIPKYINRIDEMSEMRATAEREMYGFYNTNGEQITNLTIEKGNSVVINCRFKITDPDTLIISADGVIGANFTTGGHTNYECSLTIDGNEVGTGTLTLFVSQDSSVNMQLPITVVPIREMYGFYDTNGEQITDLTIEKGNSVVINCRYKLLDGDAPYMTADGATAFGVEYEGYTTSSQCTLKVNGNEVGSGILTVFASGDPSVNMQLPITVVPIREMYGFYDTNGQPITDLTIEKGNSVVINCRYKLLDGDAPYMTADGATAFGVEYEGYTTSSQCTLKVNGNEVGSGILTVFASGDPSVNMQLPITVVPIREMYGFYDTNGERITDLTIEKGSSVVINCNYKILSNDTLRIDANNNCIGANFSGNIQVDTCQLVIQGNEVGTATLKVSVAQDSSVYMELPITVVTLREMYGFYDENGQKITDLTIEKGSSAVINCKYKMLINDNLTLDTNNTGIGVNFSEGTIQLDSCQLVISGNEVGTTTLKLFIAQDPSVYMELPVTVTATSDTNVEVEKITLNKNEATIKVGDTLQLSATITPTNATNKNISWSVSDTSIASVDSKGLITAISTGTVKVYATSQSDTSVRAECEVTVISKDTESSTIELEEGKDKNGKLFIYIKNTSDKEIEKVTINGKEITTKDEDGRYYFYTTENEEYNIVITYKDSSTEELKYTEIRSSADNNESDGDKEDIDSSEGDKEKPNSSAGDKEENDKETGKSTSTSTSDKTKTTLSSLPYAGIKEKILVFLVIVGIISIIAWFKSRDIKY